MYYQNGLWNNQEKTIETSYLFAECYNFDKFTINYSPILRPTIGFNKEYSKINFGIGKKDIQVLYEIIELIKNIERLYICAELPDDLLLRFKSKSKHIYYPTTFGKPGYAIINSDLDEIFYIVDSMPRDITEIRITNIEPSSEKTWKSLWRKLKEFTNLKTLVIMKKPNKKITIPNQNLLLNINKFDTNIYFDINYFLENSKTTKLSCQLRTYVYENIIQLNKYLIKSRGLRIIGDNRSIIDTTNCLKLTCILHRNRTI